MVNKREMSSSCFAFFSLLHCDFRINILLIKKLFQVTIPHVFTCDVEVELNLQTMPSVKRKEIKCMITVLKRFR